MRKLALLMALVMVFAVAGMASASIATIDGVAFNDASNSGHSNAKLLSDGTNTISGTGDILTIDSTKLNAAGWATLKKAIADWGEVTGNVSFELELEDQEEIPANAFNGVDVITAITLSTTGTTYIKTINSGAFENMTELTAFTIPISQLNAPITELSDNMFKGATELASVDIRAGGITSIGANAFNGASKLATVTISSSNVASIGDGAFAGTAITSFPITGGLTRLVTIGTGAFEGCKKLPTVNLGTAAKLTTIGDNAFSGAVKLDGFTFPNPVAIPGGSGDNTNELVTIGASAFKGCKDLAKTVGGFDFTEFRKLTTIGASAFEGCEEITSIDFTDVESLSTIGDAAFKGAKKLATLTRAFDDAVLTSFGANVFDGTQLLSVATIKIRFADGVTKIGANAFWQTTPQVLFRYDTDKPALTTPKALGDFLKSVEMTGAFTGAVTSNDTIWIADSAFRENGRTLANMGIVLENRVENPDTRAIVATLYKAGFTPAGIARAFDTAGGAPGSLINPTYPLTVEVVEDIVKSIIEGDGDYDYDGDYGYPGGPADPGAPGTPGDPGASDGGSSSGCDVTGLAPLAALLALGLAKVRKHRG